MCKAKPKPGQTIDDVTTTKNVDMSRRTGTHDPFYVDTIIKKRLALIEAQAKREQEKEAKRLARKANAGNGENVENTGNVENTENTDSNKPAKPLFKGVRSFTEWARERDAVLDFLESERWAGGVECAHCGFTGKMWQRKEDKRRYKCSKCYGEFTVTTGSIFAERKLAESDILFCILYENMTFDGCNSVSLGNYMEITSRTAYELGMTIRKIGYDQDVFIELLGKVPAGMRRNIIEIDITAIDDGDNRNRHIGDKLTATEMYARKVKILTIRQRGGITLAFEIPDETAGTVEAIFYAYLLPIAKKIHQIFTDEAEIFKILGVLFKNKHKAVNHSQRYSVDGYIHIQTAENAHTQFQAQFNTFRKGVQNKYKIFYISAVVFKMNTSEMNQEQKMRLVVRNIFKHAKIEMQYRLKEQAKQAKVKPLNEIYAVVA